MADMQMQLPPGYEDAKPVQAQDSGVQLPPGYEDAKPVSAKSSPEREALIHPDVTKLPSVAGSNYEMRPVLPSGERVGKMEASPVQHKLTGKAVAGGLWDAANTPVLPEGEMEKTANEYASEQERLGHPYRSAFGKTVADTGKAARQLLTSPLSVATLGAAPALEEAGAAGKAVGKLLPVAFGARGGQEAVEGAENMKEKGVTPENLQQTLEGASQAALGGAGAVEGTHAGEAPLKETLTAPVRAASRALRPIAPVLPYAAGEAVAGFPGYVAAKMIAPKEAIARGLEAGTVVGLPEEEANARKLETRAKDLEKKAAATQADVDMHKASAEQGLEVPEQFTKANAKAQTLAQEARAHADIAREAADKAAKGAPEEKPITADHMNGVQNDIDRMAPRPKMPVQGGSAKRPLNVKLPGEVQPETIERPTEELPTVPRVGQETLANNQGRMGKTLALREAPLDLPQEVLPPEKETTAPAAEKQPNTVEAGFAPVPPDETIKPKPIGKTVEKVGDLVSKGLGNEPIKPGVPLKEQTSKFGKPIRSEVEPEVEEPKNATAEKPKEIIPPEKISSDPRKAVLQQAGATPEEIEKILERGAQTPTSKIGLSKLAEHFGVDLGQSAIGRGKGDIAAGTHMSPADVLKKIIDAGHSPADITKAVDEGKHLPPVSGGSQGADEENSRSTGYSQKADKRYPATNKEGADELNARLAEEKPRVSLAEVLLKGKESMNSPDVERGNFAKWSERMKSSLDKNFVESKGKDIEPYLKIIWNHLQKNPDLKSVGELSLEKDIRELPKADRDELKAMGIQWGEMEPSSKEETVPNISKEDKLRLKGMGVTDNLDEQLKKFNEGQSKTSEEDNKHFEQAKKELGPDAFPSDYAKRAQELKEAAKPVKVDKAADDYNKAEGLPKIEPEKVDKDKRVAEIADDYAKMKHDPNDPEVKKSYKALVDDVKKQWNYAKDKMGIKMEPTDQDPYKSYEEMKDDVDKNKIMKVWRGGNPLPEDHPLAKVDPDTGETYNTMFRAVHDIFGHVAQDHDFSEPGEESAWNVHRQMMNPEAVPAMTTETRGQTSWFYNNEGVRGGEPLGKFADQKAGLLPEYANERTPDAGSVLSHIKSGKDYAVLTAENPDNTRISPEENSKRNRELAKDLREKGYKPVPVEGSNADVEGNKEHSFFVPDITPKDAAELAKKHGQESVLTTEGLHHLKTDMLQRSDNGKLLTGDEATKQDYSTKVGDEAFSVPLSDKMEYVGKERRSAERPTMNATELEDAMKNRKPVRTPFDDTEGARDTIKKDLEERGLGSAQTKETEPKTENKQGEPLSYEHTQDQHHIITKDTNGKKIGELVAKDNAPGTVEVMSNQIYDKSLRGKGRGQDQITHLLDKVGDDIHTVKSDISTSTDARNAWDKLVKQDPEAVTKKTFKDGQVQYSVDMAKWRGEDLPTVSGGSPAAGAAEAKTPKLPKLAEEHLTPEEKSGVTKSEAGRNSFVEHLKALPSVKEFTDIAKAGEGGKDWYSRSVKAFDALHEEAPKYFQEGDRSKFTDFVASLSPQQTVTMNLKEALNAWTKYVDEGRPTGKPLEKLLKEELTLPGAKVPNAMKALAGEPLWPDLSKNNSFKVPSFAKNLQGYLNHVTNDGWQGLFGGLDAKELSKPTSYHPLSVVTRAAADALGWDPAEAQAAIWAFTKTFTEKGETDPKIIRRYSEDFADIMAHDPEVRQQLAQLGVDHDKLDAKLRAIGKKPEITPGASSSTENSIRKLANRIETARGKGTIPPPKSEYLDYGEPDEEEDTSFNPEQFRTQTSERINAKKKGKLGKIGS
jgi:Protein of unknown function (DUF3293)